MSLFSEINVAAEMSLLDSVKVQQNATIRAALSRLEQSHLGVVLLHDDSDLIVGLASEGDIRRKLLSGATLDDPVYHCANTQFVRATPSTPLEIYLKQLDQRVRVIPVLDDAGRLLDVVTRERLPFLEQSKVYVRARAPSRISFGGGGSDLTYYFAKNGGAVINSAVSLYSHATMRIRSDAKISIISGDLRARLDADDLADALKKPGPFGLIQALLRSINPSFGFDLFLHSDFPAKSGLGGSAVVAAAVLGCFNQLRNDKWNSYELAELAYQAERIYLGVEGGWQDQYATIFGGVNFLEFKMEQNLIQPLRIRLDTMMELEASLVLCDTGSIHESGDIHKDQRKSMRSTNTREFVRANVELTYRLRDLLLRGRLREFGEALGTAWNLKRKLSRKISNDWLDSLYAGALQSGASGGKLLGAGGGGFFLFYAPPFRVHELRDFIASQSCTVQPFRFDLDGMMAWTVRE